MLAAVVAVLAWGFGPLFVREIDASASAIVRGQRGSRAPAAEAALTGDLLEESPDLAAGAVERHRTGEPEDLGR